MSNFHQFVAKIRETGIAKPNAFYVVMPPPRFLAQDADQNRIEHINLMCQQATIPEMVLNTAAIRDDGLERQVLVNKAYGRANFVFLLDQDMIIKKYFDDWLQNCVTTRGGTFAYASEYTVDTITVNQLNAARDVVYTVQYHDCYPVIMNELGLSMSETGGYHRLSVQFVYRWWESLAVGSEANLSNVPDDVSQFLQNERENNRLPGVPQLKSLNANLRNSQSIFDKAIDGAKHVYNNYGLGKVISIVGGN